jgi:hypothetical protein
MVLYRDVMKSPRAKNGASDEVYDIVRSCVQGWSPGKERTKVRTPMIFLDCCQAMSLGDSLSGALQDTHKHTLGCVCVCVCGTQSTYFLANTKSHKCAFHALHLPLFCASTPFHPNYVPCSHLGLPPSFPTSLVWHHLSLLCFA